MKFFFNNSKPQTREEKEDEDEDEKYNQDEEVDEDDAFEYGTTDNMHQSRDMWLCYTNILNTFKSYVATQAHTRTPLLHLPFAARP